MVRAGRDVEASVVLSPYRSLAPGRDRRGRASLPRASGSEFRFPDRGLRSARLCPSETRRGCLTQMLQAPRSSTPETTSRSWSGWPRSTSPQRRGRCARVFRMGLSRDGGSPRCGTSRRPATPSGCWPTSLPVRASSGWWSPRRTTGARSCTCSRLDRAPRARAAPARRPHRCVPELRPHVEPAVHPRGPIPTQPTLGLSDSPPGACAATIQVPSQNRTGAAGQRPRSARAW